MEELIRRHRPRWEAFVQAMEFIRFEQVPGAVLEFGVFAGASLALLGKALSFEVEDPPRRLIGFDSFAGLPPGEETHAHWKEGDCAVTHAWHPLAPLGTPVTPRLTLDLFAACDLPAPELVDGPFEETLPPRVPGEIPEVALVHIDCDLYESTRTVLAGLAPALQEGTVLLFDDWFHYRGNPNRGEARAFHEFLAEHPEWGATHYRTYATFCNGFILYRK